MRFTRSRNNSSANLVPVDVEPPPPPPDPSPPSAPHTNVWSAETAPSVTYFVRSPWEWVMKDIATEGMTQVSTVVDLPTEKQKNANEMTPSSLTPATRRRRNGSKVRGPSTLKIEVTDPETGRVDFAVHGTSSALDGLEDKDELVRTLQRMRVEHLNISPPSVLMSWDVTHEECLNVVGEDLPSLTENTSDQKFAVLKEPMGSQGKGIYFIKTAEEIHHVIDDHRQRALNEPDFLDNLIAAKGRIPSWVLQAEVAPTLLIKDRRKFHIRTYVVVVEKLHLEELFEVFIFNRHEVRIAGVPVPKNDKMRDPVSHITNGALSNSTERVLLHNLDELTSRDLQRQTEVFVAEIFGKHILPDITRRVSNGAVQEADQTGLVSKFAIAGLDIMVTEEGKLYLLEANINPAAPRESTVDDDFKEHLKGFLRCLVDLVVGKPTPEFLATRDILVREGLAT